MSRKTTVKVAAFIPVKNSSPDVPVKFNERSIEQILSNGSMA